MNTNMNIQSIEEQVQTHIKVLKFPSRQGI